MLTFSQPVQLLYILVCIHNRFLQKRHVAKTKIFGPSIRIACPVNAKTLFSCAITICALLLSFFACFLYTLPVPLNAGKEGEIQESEGRVGLKSGSFNELDFLGKHEIDYFHPFFSLVSR